MHATVWRRIWKRRRVGGVRLPEQKGASDKEEAGGTACKKTKQGKSPGKEIRHRLQLPKLSHPVNIVRYEPMWRTEEVRCAKG
jgi:hypothetical protein